MKEKTQLFSAWSEVANKDKYLLKDLLISLIVRQESFSPHEMSDWNRLPQLIVTSHMVETFKATVSSNID